MAIERLQDNAVPLQPAAFRRAYGFEHINRVQRHDRSLSRQASQLSQIRPDCGGFDAGAPIMTAG
jgi:hypothetical protein